MLCQCHFVSFWVCPFYKPESWAGMHLVLWANPSLLAGVNVQHLLSMAGADQGGYQQWSESQLCCMTLGLHHSNSGTPLDKTTVKSENTDTPHFFLDPIN